MPPINEQIRMPWGRDYQISLSMNSNQLSFRIPQTRPFKNRSTHGAHKGAVNACEHLQQFRWHFSGRHLKPLDWRHSRQRVESRQPPADLDVRNGASDENEALNSPYFGDFTCDNAPK